MDNPLPHVKTTLHDFVFPSDELLMVQRIKHLHTSMLKSLASHSNQYSPACSCKYPDLYGKSSEYILKKMEDLMAHICHILNGQHELSWFDKVASSEDRDLFKAYSIYKQIGES